MLLIGFALMQFLTFIVVISAPVRHPIGPRARYVMRWGYSVSITGGVAFLAGLALLRRGAEPVLWTALSFFWMGTLILIFSKWWVVADRRWERDASSRAEG
ncbi:hypothetical protein [Kitasatospora sp. NPDC085879]|uniref:hypothetical protein n=1 Tax=Kitasatospora sp. NPDC085879 TaxID=3154769 RepID=UPI000BB0E2BB|nr:hypothetical protein [Streptomyces sp. TLI_235]PBC69849.1 hypothetical protein BX265_7208 [Streptomyces sp. TLI_235]